MRLLFTLLTDSFVISSRNFTLVYILLFSLLLFGSLLNVNQWPDLSAQWLGYGVILLLLFAAIMAGWFNMVAQACVRFLSVPRTEALQQNYVVESMKLFQSFFPGVGRFFNSFSLVFGLNAIILMGLGYWIRPSWLNANPLLLKAATLPIEQREVFINSLSIAQKMAVGEFSLLFMLGALIYGVFWALTLLWPVYVIFYRQGGLQACFSSMGQFFRDPLRYMALILILALLGIPLFLVTGLSGPSNLFLAIALQFLNLLLQVFFAVLIFLYGYQIIGKPLPPEVAETDKPDEALKPPPTP